jgi:Transcriptional regulator, contains sigma factor-related N-terminal domain
MEKKPVDRRLYSTKLLLKSLSEMREYIADVIMTPADLGRDFTLRCLMNDLRNDPDVCLKSTRQSRARTMMLVAHVERVLAKWESEARSTDAKRRRHVAQMFYIEKMTDGEISEKMNIKRHVVREIWRTAIAELAPMFFGADGVMRELEEVQK